MEVASLKHTYIAVLILVIAGGLAYFVFAFPDAATRRHRSAMERWPILASNGFQADPKEIEATFFDCFRKGDPAGPYESIFATASRKNVIPKLGSVEYVWSAGPNEADKYFL